MNENFEKVQKNPNPRETANPISAATFSYMIPTFLTGFKRDLEISDLSQPLTAHKASLLGDKIEKLWILEEERAKQSKFKFKPSLTRVLLKMFGLDIFIFALILIISEACLMIQPLALGQLLTYFGTFGTKISQNEAYYFAGAVVASSFLHVVISYPYMLGLLHMGMKMRIACSSLIYRKMLTMNQNHLNSKTSSGQIVNLLTNDVARFDIAVMYIHDIWMGPVETVVATYFMYQQIGISAIIGVVFIILIIPTQIFLGNKISDLRLKTAVITDERMRFMNEIISGIQVIKMYAWEKPFARLIASTRKSEVDTIKKASYIKGITSSFIIYITRISIFASITAFVLLDNSTISAQKAYVVTGFYGILLYIMAVFFPQGITQAAEVKVSLNRLSEFLNNQSDDENDEKSAWSKQIVEVSLKNFTAKWKNSSMSNTLGNINLEIAQKELVAVIGPVGSGKSSLIQAILRELPPIQGQISVKGSISYASQEAWLFSGSIKQNILFGLPFDKSRYDRVVEVCALAKDFQILPHSDRTLIGDRGVTLSGGQKARVNLARAVYKNADIYLLDDPLSAVDANVGKHLFEKCIKEFLIGKIVVLVTHQLQYLESVGHILYLEDGCIRREGNYREIRGSQLRFVEASSTSTSEEKNEEDEIEGKAVNLGSNSEKIEEISKDENGNPSEIEEQRTRGTIKLSFYTNYFKSGGNFCFISIFFLLFIITQIFVTISDYFITYWINLEQDKESSQNDQIILFWPFTSETAIYIYTFIIVSLVFFTITRSLVFFNFCMRASIKLHDGLFKSITKASLRFFNTNPSGRVLNRFSKDIGIVDEMLPSTLMNCFQNGLNVIGYVILIGIVNPLLIIPVLSIFLIVYCLRIFYIRTSRSLKRLEGVTRSPVYSHLNASIQGLVTIRAFGAGKILGTEFDDHQDLHSSSFYSFLSSTSAFGYWLDMLSVIYLTFVTFGLITFINDSYAGNVGLAVSQAISITGMMQWCAKQTAELENQITSIERIGEYTNPLIIEHEDNFGKQPKPTNWPNHGQIEFQNVSLSYFPTQTPNVLKNLSFTIAPREKIGIVGRTGAGKSSLISAIFRLQEPNQGSIIIDGVDTKLVDLHDLRSSISIIPQEPVLFSGTIRKNLDPFDQYADCDLWEALGHVELREVVAVLYFGLNSMVSQGGSNFSVGQKQLICLARAILRKNKILILDEATANVDPQTDRLIQNTIRGKFLDCTVLTVAHRLNTVMDSDKILVMEDGRIIEFGHPSYLIRNQSGALYQMVKGTGKNMADDLFRIAQDSFENL